ncbi:hypothetical protein CMQ_5839 [Grosmannia clavigera kw1407]|uniref:Uncharacterized protein n=1 Tax=Grosmannia clavigera (strain kw1407 / UAMH 11150) TaxID=655863 RepID=F0XIF6_GROCL|nr:uncharacterized protein CMQ_5839 [Grosmannia clavigera kw1407]EFX02478.1 hypothetical protein CMQ_5839 [Grosmannia clavigera kw1407]
MEGKLGEAHTVVCACGWLTGCVPAVFGNKPMPAAANEVAVQDATPGRPRRHERRGFRAVAAGEAGAKRCRLAAGGREMLTRYRPDFVVAVKSARAAELIYVVTAPVIRRSTSTRVQLVQPRDPVHGLQVRYVYE